MKKFILTLSTLFAASTLAFSWGFQGHATIAQVAENHLTPEVKALITSYFGGYTMVAFASDADIYRGRWLKKLDFEPTNPKEARPAYVKDIDPNTPANYAIYSHTMTVDGNFEPLRSLNYDGTWMINAVVDCNDIIKELKAGYKTMDPARRQVLIAVLIHLVGDFHCPDHVGYPGDHPAGWFDIKFMDNKMKRHQLWDDNLLRQIVPWGFSETARIVDICSEEEIAKITKGDIWAYGKASALDCFHVHSVAPGAELPRTYAGDERLFVFSQLRNGGYRLAAILNDIFKQQ